MTSPSRQSRVFCEVYVEHPTDSWGGCYCKLWAGHEGPHSGHYPQPPEPEAGADYSPHPNVGRLS